jgi:5'-methylthioadenosine phosphorylase
MLRTSMTYCLGIVGGSGIYDIDGLDNVREEVVNTPYGKPSDAVISATYSDTKLLFIPRHGRGHVVAPHEINYRANICALKQLGATHLVSLSAVGSMREDIIPGHVITVDQYIDFTKKRVSTFFEGGIVGHVALADPVCPLLANSLALAAEKAGAIVHKKGTYLCMEGPQFSSRAESHLYRSWGISVIGMTAMPEAKLAREAELPYATLAMATDYDCWHEDHDDVSVEAVIEVLQRNAAMAKRCVIELLKILPDPAKSIAHRALDAAVMTTSKEIPQETSDRLKWLWPRP